MPVKGSRAAIAALAVLALQAHAQVEVRDGHLVRDGKPWAPRGVVQIAFVAPPAAQAGVFAEAYQHYRPSDYASMRRYGIDAVRMQVSQPGLEEGNALYDARFRAQVIDAVHAARAAGLVVMLSVQDEEQSGENPKTVAFLPNEHTRTVWKSIAPEFRSDKGVMYELLNEPQLHVSPLNWQLWGEAMNRTIDVVRNAGAGNVIVADGLNVAERLTGAPELNDPLHQVVYASHPYAHDRDGQAEASWAMKFGDFARSHPVVVTEWAPVPKFYCDGGTPAYSKAFLDYIDERGIGLMAYGWDFSGPKFGSMFHGFPPALSTFQGKQCGDPGFGPGDMIERRYRQAGNLSP
jgi:endoglucanase